MQLLDGKEKSLFEDFSKAYSELNGLMSVESFIIGFSLGAMLMTEALETTNKLLRE